MCVHLLCICFPALLGRSKRLWAFRALDYLALKRFLRSLCRSFTSVLNPESSSLEPEPNASHELPDEDVATVESATEVSPPPPSRA